MTKHNLIRRFGAMALVASVIAIAHAQQAPAGGGAPPAGQKPPATGSQAGGGGQPQQDNTRVLIVGENPSITHRAQPGRENPAIAEANFWRVTWSPVGPGTACFIKVNEPTPNATKMVITDNPKLAEYIAKDVLGRLMKDFNDPPYVVMQGTVTQTNEGATARTDTCKSGNTTVELKWMGLGEPRWSAPGFGVNMTLVIVPTASAEIVINGKRAPGAASSGFMALNETWRVDR
jgi:hypothetical protein